MRAFLDKKFLLIIILITSCDQTAEINSNLEDDTEKIVEAIFEVPLKLDDKFKQENNLDNWSEFNRLEYNILVLANSISGYLDNDFNYLSETLNSLANNSDDILGSEFQLYQDRLEIKGRMKLLNIQIQKTKLNIKDWDKKKGLEELDKILGLNLSSEMSQSNMSDYQSLKSIFRGRKSDLGGMTPHELRFDKKEIFSKNCWYFQKI